MQKKPYFIITIDTEGDNLWSRPRIMTTSNAVYLQRFQVLCEKFNFKPVYLTDFEMAMDSNFVKLAKKAVQNNACEVGMHLHAWNTPPLIALTNDDYHNMPFLVEYPLEHIEEKVALMRGLLQDIFGLEMYSHRAGRWSFDERYAQVLIRNGVKVDCSVTPNVSWVKTMGDPQGRGGTDFTNFPSRAYFVNENAINESGTSSLLEVPMTILPEQKGNKLNHLRKIPFLDPLVKSWNLRQYKPVRWLRPNGYNLKDMLDVVDTCKNEEREYMMFMLHSSEFMPGGSPIFDSAEKIEKLYADLETLFQKIAGDFEGVTLKDFYLEKVRRDSRPEYGK